MGSIKQGTISNEGLILKAESDLQAERDKVAQARDAIHQANLAIEALNKEKNENHKATTQKSY